LYLARILNGCIIRGVMTYLKKLISGVLVVIAIANLLLFAFGTFSPLPFWIIIAIIAILAYFVVPRLP
jgi:hypothetical protein